MHTDDDDDERRRQHWLRLTTRELRKYKIHKGNSLTLSTRMLSAHMSVERAL